MFDEIIRQAEVTNSLILTTVDAFIDFDDILDFLKQASSKGITVTFAPKLKTELKN